MASSDHTAPAAGDAPPAQILLNPTMRCNYRCAHCDLPPESRREDIPLAIAAGAISAIHERFGTRWLTLAGGEPLLYGGLLDLVAHAKELGWGVNISSNGALMTGRLAGDLGHWGLDRFDLSLDGFEEGHDSLRGRGAFRAALAGLEMVRAHAPSVGIGVTAVIQRYNAERLVEFAEYCLSLPGVSALNLQAFVSHKAHERDAAWYHGHALWPRDLGLLRDQLDELARRAETDERFSNPPDQLRLMKRYFDDPTRFVVNNCASYKRLLVIDASGEVKYCTALGSAGNLRGKAFGEIWDSPARHALREEAGKCRRVCHMLVNCGFLQETLDAPGSSGD